jgi:hypothetical protein
MKWANVGARQGYDAVVFALGRFVGRASYIVNIGSGCLLCGLLQVNKGVMAPTAAEYTHFCNKYNQKEGGVRPPSSPRYALFHNP